MSLPITFYIILLKSNTLDIFIIAYTLFAVIGCLFVHSVASFALSTFQLMKGMFLLSLQIHLIGT